LLAIASYLLAAAIGYATGTAGIALAVATLFFGSLISLGVAVFGGLLGLPKKLVIPAGGIQQLSLNSRRHRK
jgi:hypothetical protein